MSGVDVTLRVRTSDADQSMPVDAVRTSFSAFQCFNLEGDAEETALLKAAGAHLRTKTNLVIHGATKLTRALFDADPELPGSLKGVVLFEGQAASWLDDFGVATLDPSALQDTSNTIFQAELRRFPRMQTLKQIGEGVEVCNIDFLVEVAPDLIPRRAWIPISKNIYPIDIPEIEIEKGLDMLLIDCPARNLALMPNGLGYVHNALKRADIKHQTFDLDIVTYHRYHVTRIYDEGGETVLPDGRVLPIDPWQAEHYDLWNDQMVIDYFKPIIHEAAAAIIEAEPKVMGLSVQQCNEDFSKELIRLVKAARPSIVVLVGGFSCYNADIGRRGFPDCDYMCIGEADLTVGPLAEQLARGERPYDLPGVISRYDTPNRKFVPAPMPHNLESLDYPRYEWFSIDIYKNFNGYQLTPIIASRGCRWSRCTFCAERFYWRIRPEEEFVDELEYLVDQGCNLFMFNESDLNGNPDKLLAICDEIIRRDINVKLTGQLRIHKKSDRAFFDKLRAAGFVALRFGVDAFSASTMRLQKKGYTPDIVSQNLKDCWEAGIYTEVNWVIGVPGETDADVEEGVKLLLDNRDYIGRIANINPLILVNGSVYWIDPDAHNIHFRRPKPEMYEKFPRALPADMWYSTEPYIDAAVRRKRFEKIVISLLDADFPLGAWAERVIDDVQSRRDKNRSGGLDLVDGEAVVENVDMLPPDPTQKITPVLVRRIGQTAIYSWDGQFYGVDGRVDLSVMEDIPAEIKATAIVADSEGEVADRLETSGIDVRSAAATKLGTHSGYDLFLVDGAYYGARSDAGLDPNTLPSMPNGVLKAASEPLLCMEIDRVGAWGDSRGQWDSQQVQRRRGTMFKVNSATQEDETVHGFDDFELISFNDQFFAVERENFKKVGLDAAGWDVAYVSTKGAEAELIRAADTLNIVEFDGMYYSVPHGLSPAWGEEDPAMIEGVVCDSNLAHLERAVGIERKRLEKDPNAIVGAEALPSDAPEPQLVKEHHDFNIVFYEGLYYGIPHAAGPIDLRETDVIGMKGIVLDVTQIVVENEINDMVAVRTMHAAE